MFFYELVLKTEQITEILLQRKPGQQDDSGFYEVVCSLHSAEFEMLSEWYFSHCKIHILQFPTLLLQLQSLCFIAAF